MKIYQSNESMDFNPIKTKDHKRTKKYQLCDSEQIINQLTELGFEHKGSSFASPRKLENRGYQKHILLFTREDLKIDDDNYMQIMVTNSHDGKSSLRLNLGVYRAVCANGLVVGQSFEEIRIRHQGADFYNKLKESLYNIVARAPKIAELVRKMQNVQLTRIEELHLMGRIAEKRLEKVEDLYSIKAESLTRRKRKEDTERDLYTVFNVIQEKVIRGGITYWTEKEEEVDGTVIKLHKKNTTRAVRGIDSQVELNKMVWNEVEKLVA